MRLHSSRVFYRQLVKQIRPEATVQDVLFHFRNPRILRNYVGCKPDIHPESQIGRRVRRAFKALSKDNAKSNARP